MSLSAISKNQAGYSLVEILVVLTISFIVSGTAIYNIKETINPAITGSDAVVSHYKLIRSAAISNTKAYLINAASSTVVAVSSRDTCSSSEDWVAETSLQLTLPNGASFSDSDWSVCVNSRGFPDSNIIFSVLDNDSTTREIEIFLGGSIEVG